MSSDDVKTPALESAPTCPESRTDGWTRRAMKGLPASIDALWVQREGDSWRYALQVDKSHANSQGVIHGGVLMTFMDHALSLMIWEASGRAMCSTVHLDNHFLKAVRPPAFVELHGEIRKQGRSLAFARGVLRVDGTDVMEATGVWSITPAPQSSAS